MIRLRHRGLTVALLLAALPLAAQSTKDLAKAAATITEADVRRRIFIIADDSMRGRDTPSPGLEMTAAYVANEFKQFGLKPAGDSGTWFVRMPLLRRQLLAERSVLTFGSADGSQIALPFASSTRVLDGATAAMELTGGVVVVSSAADAKDLKPEDFKDRVVVWPLDLDKLPPTVQASAGAMIQAGAKLLVVVTPTDSATFAARLAGQALPRVSREGQSAGGGPLVLEVPEREIVAQFPAAAQTLSEVRSAPSTVVQVLPDWTASLTIQDSVIDRTSAPVAVGLLEGRDKKLRGSYLVYSAHMDHIGVAGGQCEAMGADSICNGADDDGSGTVGVVELAEAFSQKKVRPKRSVLFIGVSGEEKGLWGSSWFVDHPTVPLDSIVADLNIDMIGRNWKDTVVAIGREHSNLGGMLDSVNARHPELGMRPVADLWPQENLYFRSDHYNFARKGIPILFFTTGLHADYHKASDSPDKIDAEKEARLLQLLFYLGEDVANNPVRPEWNPESYEKIVKGGAN
jgi:hypothetical protein